jgi:hypothetical protein
MWDPGELRIVFVGTVREGSSGRRLQGKMELER